MTTTTSTVSSSSAGLAGLVGTSASGVRLTAYTAAGAIDPIRELGLELEQKQYDTRLLALTKPGDYARDRKLAFDEMVVKIEGAYNDAYSGFIKAGLPSEMAKRYALNAANNEKAVRRQVLETLYPSNANIIGDAQSVAISVGARTIAATRPRRRATAKPRKARRR